MSPSCGVSYSVHSLISGREPTRGLQKRCTRKCGTTVHVGFLTSSEEAARKRGTRLVDVSTMYTTA